MTCIFSENVCAYSDKSSKEERTQEIQNIINDCNKNIKSNYESKHEFDYVSVEELDEDYLQNKQRHPAKIMAEYYNYYNRSRRSTREKSTNCKKYG